MAVQDFYFFGSYNAFRPFKIKVFSGADSKFTIPTLGTGYNYRAKVAGVVDVSGLTGNYTINFPSANTDYVLEIYGLFPHFYNPGTLPQIEVDKLREMIQWGDVEFSSLSTMFYRARYCVYTATDTPKFKAGAFVSMYSFMHNASLMNINFSNWNATQINSMANCFNGATSQTYDVDFSDTIKGSVNLKEIGAILGTYNYASNAKIKVLKLQAVSVTDWTPGFYNQLRSDKLEIFELIGMRVTFNIQYIPLLLGSNLNNLFTSLGIANTGASIIISSLQNASGITTSIATLKGWTIIVV